MQGKRILLAQPLIETNEMNFIFIFIFYGQ